MVQVSEPGEIGIINDSLETLQEKDDTANMGAPLEVQTSSEIPVEEVAFNTEDTLVPCDNQFSILEGLAEAEAQENEIMANISLGEKSKQKKSSKHKSKGVPLSIRTRAMIGKSTGPKYNSS